MHGTTEVVLHGARLTHAGTVDDHCARQLLVEDADAGLWLFADAGWTLGLFVRCGWRRGLYFRFSFRFGRLKLFELPDPALDALRRAADLAS